MRCLMLRQDVMLVAELHSGIMLLLISYLDNESR
jgi:hypothetical protein